MSIAVALQITAAANVKIDGEVFDGARIVGSVTYVPVRAFSKSVGEYDVGWNNADATATIASDDVDVSMKIGEKYIEGNGRIIYSGNANIIIDGRTYVPVRSIAKTLGATVEWDSETKTALIGAGGERFASADEFYDANDLYWLAKIINAESEGEPLEGKIAVGNVVLNRVKSPDFPNSVYDVVFDKKGGVQFTPVANGSISKYPNEESFVAAKICLEDYRLSTKEILFFLNPATSTSAWVPNNRDFVMSVGNHDFYA